MSMRSFVDDEERFSRSKDIRPLTRAATRPRSYTATVYDFVANTRTAAPQTANCFKMAKKSATSSASKETVPWHNDLLGQAKHLAHGDHPLSKYIPPALLLCDALLCSLIISKVECKLLVEVMSRVIQVI
jgi:hypothetical protein